MDQCLHFMTIFNHLQEALFLKLIAEVNFSSLNWCELVQKSRLTLGKLIRYQFSVLLRPWVMVNDVALRYSEQRKWIQQRLLHYHWLYAFKCKCIMKKCSNWVSKVVFICHHLVEMRGDLQRSISFSYRDLLVSPYLLKTTWSWHQLCWTLCEKVQTSAFLILNNHMTGNE